MEKPNFQETNSSVKRQRQHEILLALIRRQDDLELIDIEASRLLGTIKGRGDPAHWIDRNRRILEKYQSLVRSAITLDSLLDSEQTHNE
ncbi:MULTISPECIES: hypothetical protein [Prochlorococcus]|uniref:hypothetical protein n=1 Tax=Prochlorococcus TaxID=1218 RepID=UPI00055FC2EC|nr:MULTISPECIES: hypothetical protein [Prochlorococcus]